MKKADAMALMRNRIEAERSTLAKITPHCYSSYDYCSGLIKGLQTALYFLDEPQAVAEIEASIQKSTDELAKVGGES